MTLTPQSRVCSALEWDPNDPSIQVEALVTLPHSFVARVRKGDAAPMLFTLAGGPGFAPGVRKELLVNRDVLSRLAAQVGPARLSSNISTYLSVIG